MKHIFSKKQLVSMVMFGVLFFAGVATGTLAQFISLNGSFENGVAVSNLSTLSAGSTDIDNWTVGLGGINYIGTYWPASEGSRSIDLSGDSAGSISQVLATTPGTMYKVTFDMAGNPDGTPTLKTLGIDVGGDPEYFYFQVPVLGINPIVTMGWEPREYTFTATSTSTTLTFTSWVGTPWGPAVDNIVVSSLGPIATPTPTVTPTPSEAPSPTSEPSATPTVTPELPTDKDQCKKEGWTTYGVFNNQGECVSSVVPES